MYKTGIDVSHWQGLIDWEKVHSRGIDFAFIKATAGQDYKDPSFVANWGGSQSVGIPRGPYHWYNPYYNPINQAAWFYNHVMAIGTPPQLSWVIDLEQTGGINSNHVANVRLFMQYMFDKTGQKVMIYTSPSYWDTYFYRQTWAMEHPLWIANYIRTAPAVPQPWQPGNWNYWQYTAKGDGRYYGVSSLDLDLDLAQ